MSLLTDLQTAGLPVVSATDMPGKPRQATFSRTLTAEEEIIYLDLIYPLHQVQLAREVAAKSQALLSGQFKTATPDQAADYVQQQITNGTSEVQALTAFDAATTVVALKPILRNMLVGIYRTVDILKLMARILVAIRNKLWSDLPDL